MAQLKREKLHDIDAKSKKRILAHQSSRSISHTRNFGQSWRLTSRQPQNVGLSLYPPVNMPPKKKVERPATENISLGPQVREGL